MYVAVSSDVSAPMTQRIVCPSANVSNRISSLLKNPAKPGTPAIAMDAITNV